MTEGARSHPGSIAIAAQSSLARPSFGLAGEPDVAPRSSNARASTTPSRQSCEH